MSSTDHVLTVADLCVGYGSTQDTVSRFNLKVAPGERVGIIGESGSGKSTVALGIFGLLPEPGRVTAGTVHLSGVELTAMSPSARRRVHGKDIGLIYQDASTSIDPLKRIDTQLAEAVRAHRRVRPREMKGLVCGALESVGLLPRHAKSYPHELSGGMRQRVAIAIALVNNPSVVIADEPTTALDVTTQANVLRVLDERVLTQGCALVLVTHDLGVVSDHCDTTVVMHGGQAVESGCTKEVLSSPSHHYTQALVECHNALDDRALRRLPALKPAMFVNTGAEQGRA